MSDLKMLALLAVAGCDLSPGVDERMPESGWPVSGVCYGYDVNREPKCPFNIPYVIQGDLLYADFYPPPAVVFKLKITQGVCENHADLRHYCEDVGGSTDE